MFALRPSMRRRASRHHPSPGPTVAAPPTAGSGTPPDAPFCAPQPVDQRRCSALPVLCVLCSDRSVALSFGACSAWRRSGTVSVARFTCRWDGCPKPGAAAQVELSSDRRGQSPEHESQRPVNGSRTPHDAQYLAVGRVAFGKRRRECFDGFGRALTGTSAQKKR